MISLHDLRGVPFGPMSIPARAELDVDSAIDKVRPIVEEVRDGGEEAVLALCERFDGIRPASLRVPRGDIERSLAALDPQVRASLAEAILRVRKVHRGQRREDSRTELAPGASVTMRWIAVDRVGLYVPGGRAVYPSSVVMNVVAAQEAGVRSLAIASPPQKDFGGLPHPTVLAAAAMLGVEEVYAVGGAQAIAMFAYGVRDSAGESVCDKADLVTGPGNIWVAAAKRLLKGRVGIDSEAGPTEIAILADDSADPGWIAADLISQAEHDVLAASVLVTTSHGLALSVIRGLERQVPSAKHEARIREALGGQQSGVYVVDDLDTGLKMVNAYAAEHLEIHTRDAATIARKVTSAGAVFVGPYAPVSLGDYVAGSNHVLPTGGNALHTSGLSVQTFLRGIPLIEYDQTALREVSHHVITLSGAEDLPAHGHAVAERFRHGTEEVPSQGAGRGRS
jgi:histidinol dehydrogenase